MRHLFIPSPNGKQLLNGERGTLREIPDAAVISGTRPVLTTQDGVTDYVPPPPPTPTPPAPTAAQILQAAEKTGIPIPFGEFTVTLACDEKARALFASALALYRAAEDLLPDEAAQAAFRDSEVTFADASGTPHQLTITQARQLLVAYGLAYQTLWVAAAGQPS